MQTIKILFHKCVQDCRQAGSDGSRMVSRVFLTLEAGGRRHPNLHVDLHQAPGGTFADGALQVGLPQGYAGPLNDYAFKTAAERYYRSLARVEPARAKVSFGKSVRRYDHIVIHEAGEEIQVYQ
jgi:hypothetical protein